MKTKNYIQQIMLDALCQKVISYGLHWDFWIFLLFLAEQINLILFYYVQDVYQKNPLGPIVDKRYIIPEVNIISRKAGVVSKNRVGGSRVHLDCLKLDWNPATITVQDQKTTKNVDRSPHIQC